jgi:cob(I)alamin adenosyltransferase
MPKKKMTIEDLAVMVQGGFDEVNGKIINIRDEMDQGFKEVNQRLDRIENILIAGHDRRIERLEDNMREVKTALKIK